MCTFPEISQYDQGPRLNDLWVIDTPGSIYWNMGFGLNKGETQDDAKALQNMNHLGRVIAWLGTALSGADAAFPVLPLGQV